MYYLNRFIITLFLPLLSWINKTQQNFIVNTAFIAAFNLTFPCPSQVLDRNFKLGNKILSITLLLLRDGPSPKRFASDYQPPNYTLWYLEPHTRYSWLQTMLVILYKVGVGVQAWLLKTNA